MQNRQLLARSFAVPLSRNKCYSSAGNDPARTSRRQLTGGAGILCRLDVARVPHSQPARTHVQGRRPLLRGGCVISGRSNGLYRRSNTCSWSSRLTSVDWLKNEVGRGMDCIAFIYVIPCVGLGSLHLVSALFLFPYSCNGFRFSPLKGGRGRMVRWRSGHYPVLP